MCGIGGYFLVGQPEKDTSLVRAALAAMAHRGPDDEGISLIDPERGGSLDLTTKNSAKGVRLESDATLEQSFPHRIGFGHRRFSIVDLSPTGHQPMWDRDRRVCVAFNGEIYNYVELRERLCREGHRLTTSSDTEVMAVAFRAWGTRCFDYFNGFWALSLYDAKNRRLLLARDRLGKAPLYFTSNRRGIFWASEIRGLFAMLGTDGFDVNEQAIADFATWQRRDFEHETFFRGIRSLPSGALAWIDAHGELEVTRNWSPPISRLSTSEISIPEAAQQVRDLLDDSVRLRLRADVPAAVQLSGGMDSSAVLALATNHASRVSAFTVSFPGTDADEEPFAAEVVRRYQRTVDYTVIDPPDDDLLDHADDFIAAMSEPFHSPNQFSAKRVWQTIANRGIRVDLYGSGGDEVFAGYSHFYFYPYLRSLARAGKFSRFLTEIRLFSERPPGPFGIDVLLRLARSAPGAERFHRRLFNSVPQRRDPLRLPSQVQAWRGPSNDVNHRLVENVTDRLLNYWLRVDNQNSMTVPLELRSPMLDYRLVDLAFTLPMEYLIRDGWMKWILRYAMRDLLPESVIWRRKKMGFPFPLHGWLGRHQTRLLAMIGPLDCPYLDIGKLATVWEEIRNQNPARLWCYVSLALWWKRCIQGDSLN